MNLFACLRCHKTFPSAETELFCLDCAESLEEGETPQCSYAGWKSRKRCVFPSGHSGKHSFQQPTPKRSNG